MITSLYAGLMALLILGLSLRVVMLRQKHRVALGDGHNPAMAAAIRAHGNALEYIPLALLLMLLVELSGGLVACLHVSGAAILLGRLLHARALYTDNLRLRVAGMMLTLLPMTGLALLSIVQGAAALAS